MPDLSFTDAFGRYGAKPRNAQWSVCALSESNELVVSLWEELFDKKLVDGALRYRDSFARWSGPGSNELRQAINEALASKRRIRAVIAHAKKPGALNSGIAGSRIPKTFSVREDWLGETESVDEDNFVIRFVRS